MPAYRVTEHFACVQSGVSVGKGTAHELYSGIYPLHLLSCPSPFKMLCGDVTRGYTSSLFKCVALHPRHRSMDATVFIPVS